MPCIRYMDREPRVDGERSGEQSNRPRPATLFFANTLADSSGNIREPRTKSVSSVRVEGAAFSGRRPRAVLGDSR
jgi:hypothetical protein